MDFPSDGLSPKQIEEGQISCCFGARIFPPQTQCLVVLCHLRETELGKVRRLDSKRSLVHTRPQKMMLRVTYI